jgi:hypothetical protein
MQEDFFISHRSDSSWLPAVPVSELNTPLNEGAQTISADGNLLFYTLCNHPEGYGSCDIYFSRWVDGSWSKPRNAGYPLNTEAWESQPSLSAFGDELFFSSNRKGGKGNRDIWSVRLHGWRPDGLPLWGTPVNLGDSINTPDNEISPFIHSNGRDLFFSSDGWPGMGGLDIFSSKKNTNGVWSRARNLGYPVNTHGNEQGLIIDRTGRTAYMASSRNPETGMDIYSFELDASIQPDPVTYVYGKVFDRNTLAPVPAAVNLTGLEGNVAVNVRLQADYDGLFTIALPTGNEYAFHVSEPGYFVLQRILFRRGRR